MLTLRLTIQNIRGAEALAEADAIAAEIAADCPWLCERFDAIRSRIAEAGRELEIIDGTSQPESPVGGTLE